MPQLPDIPLEGLYGDVIMDHYRNPRRRQSVADPDAEAHEYNPFCGDEATIQLKLDGDDRVLEVGVPAQGCSIIQSSASMMAQLLEGKTLAELEALSQVFRDLMEGKPVPDSVLEEMGDLASLQVVRQYPVRIKCALLPWTALEESISSYRSRRRAGLWE